MGFSFLFPPVCISVCISLLKNKKTDLDLITHTISGMAAGTFLAGFSNKSLRKKTGIILFSGLGGAIPDIDVISHWSKFDGTFGKLFHLPTTGKIIYSEKFWYSHHGFMHSLVAAITLTLIIAALFYFLTRKKKKQTPALNGFLPAYGLFFCGFFTGYIIHLLQDMITPGGPWGGIRFFFPSQTYVGGTGDIWWWNNYDLFLIVLAVLVINLTLLLMSHFIKKSIFKKISLVLLLAGCAFFVVHVKTRDFNFNGKPYTVCEEKSKTIQKKLLSKELYDGMSRFDDFVRFSF